MRFLALVMLVVLGAALLSPAVAAGSGRRRSGRGDGEEGGRKGQGGALNRMFRDAPAECRGELRKLAQELRKKQAELRQEYEKKAEAMLGECRAKHPSASPGPSPSGGGDAGDSGADASNEAGSAASPSEPAPSADPGAAPAPASPASDAAASPSPAPAAK